MGLFSRGDFPTVFVVEAFGAGFIFCIGEQRCIYNKSRGRGVISRRSVQMGLESRERERRCVKFERETRAAVRATGDC